MEILIVSGFLGAGKTTFINEFIQQQQKFENRKFAVLVNEFGDLSIDAEIIRKDSLEIIEIPSGCICCSLNASLPEAIDMVYEKIKPDVLLVEPSGVASPMNVLEAIERSKFAENFRMKAVICVVNASTFSDFIDDFGKFYVEQIRTADVVLINKADLVSDEEMREIEKEISKINPYAIAVRTQYCRHIPAISTRLNRLQSEERATGIILDSVSLAPKRKFTLHELEDFLKEMIDGKFGRIIRAKGFVECEGLCMFQISGKNYEIKTLKVDERNLAQITPKAVIIGSELKIDRLQDEF